MDHPAGRPALGEPERRLQWHEHCRQAQHAAVVPLPLLVVEPQALLRREGGPEGRVEFSLLQRAVQVAAERERGEGRCHWGLRDALAWGNPAGAAYARKREGSSSSAARGRRASTAASSRGVAFPADGARSIVSTRITPGGTWRGEGRDWRVVAACLRGRGHTQQQTRDRRIERLSRVPQESLGHQGAGGADAVASVRVEGNPARVAGDVRAVAAVRVVVQDLGHTLRGEGGRGRLSAGDSRLGPGPAGRNGPRPALLQHRLACCGPRGRGGGRARRGGRAGLPPSATA